MNDTIFNELFSLMNNIVESLTSLDARLTKVEASVASIFAGHEDSTRDALKTRIEKLESMLPNKQDGDRG